MSDYDQQKFELSEEEYQSTKEINSSQDSVLVEAPPNKMSLSRKRHSKNSKLLTKHIDTAGF